jgi:thiol-disulfide isomerase/thioredoxin
MKKSVKILIIVSGLLLFITAVGFYFLRPQAQQAAGSPAEAETARDLPAPPPRASSPNPIAKGAYIDYSAEALAKASGTKILFFHAPWCPQCFMLDNDIKAQKELPANLTIFKVDYDSATALRQKYGVVLQTTFVKVDKEGNQLQKYVAYNEPSFATLVREFNLR